MRKLFNSKFFIIACFLLANLCWGVSAQAGVSVDEDLSIDRLSVVSQQINLLKSRYEQAERELTSLQTKHDWQISQQAMEKASKRLLDKASLDISVSQSNLDSINIEISDARQTVGWLEKNIQEIQNQLNLLNIFGMRIARSEMVNVDELRQDLSYQQKLLELEKVRGKYLQDLQSDASNILQLKNEQYGRLSTLLKSHRMLHIKQEDVKDELAFQEQQNQWLTQLNGLYTKLSLINPAKSNNAYAAVERDIFYANERANYAYVQSLIARYKDQIQQMKLVVLKSNSINLLNETGDQAQALNKQISRLDAVLKARITVLEKHISYMSPRRNERDDIRLYLQNLVQLHREYQGADVSLITLKKTLSNFRAALDQAIQTELSSRQGFPMFGVKSLLDLGKEMLIVPALAFQVVKSLFVNLGKGVATTGLLAWSLYAMAQILFFFVFVFTNKLIRHLQERPSDWREQINFKWLGLQWLHRNFTDLYLAALITCSLWFFGLPAQNYLFMVYLSGVWLITKGILTVARVSLVETTHDSAGRDMTLYRRLKWMITAGGIITALTVFIYQLPLIYELKTLFDQIFLFFTMIVSLLLLRFWDVVPNLILSHRETRNPYIEKSIRLLGILVPLLLFGNSLLGLVGYLNLVMTVAWYEGVFLLVLVGYLLFRGLLTDGMEQLSRLVIQYTQNGWLWTEAFLKPIDRVLRITLFISSWAVLFLFYGWDKQSPIVERLTRLLHYQLVSVLNTTITPLNIIALFVVISIFYWTAKWTREFVYRLLSPRTKDMGVRNTIAILSQYSVVVLGVFFCLRVLGIDLRALAVVAGMLAFGVGLGLRDLANNFACGFLILLERPLRVGDIVSINDVEGEVTHIGSRAITVSTWDRMELVVPNTEVFNKSFINWTARDNIVRTIVSIKIGRSDNPHEIRAIIQNVLILHKDVLKDPLPEVFLKEMNDTVMAFELRYFVNIRQVKSRTSVTSSLLMNIWDSFEQHGIKPPYPQQEVFLRSADVSTMASVSKEFIEADKEGMQVNVTQI